MGWDIFVLKLSPDLSTLLVSTYIGGSGDEESWDLAVDNNDQIFLTGHTYSTDFPTTSGAFDESPNGWVDAYVLCLSSDLGSLQSCTLLGGSDSDYGSQLSVGSEGDVVVAGMTRSPQFPTSPNGEEHEDSSYPLDVFVSRLSSDLSALMNFARIGGIWDEGPKDMVLDQAGNVLVTGYTGSDDFPTTTGAYDTSFNGYTDAFVFKLSPDLSTFLASTFVGTDRPEIGYSLALGHSGEVFVLGYTSSRDFPITLGTYDWSYNGGGSDLFFAKFSPDLGSLRASTFVGGRDNELGDTLVRIENGHLLASGYTSSDDFPTTANAYDGMYNGPMNSAGGMRSS